MIVPSACLVTRNPSRSRPATANEFGMTALDALISGVADCVEVAAFDAAFSPGAPARVAKAVAKGKMTIALRDMDFPPDD